MPELSEIAQRLVPAAVVFGVAAIAVAVAVLILRRSARGPRAHAAAAAKRAHAGTRLVELDDAVDELDLEVGLSGALYGGDAPPSLRRTRITAQHARDELFELYRGTMSDDALPADVARAADRVASRAEQVLGLISRTRSEHASWMRANISAGAQIAAARARLAALRSSLGAPDALIDDLASRIDEDQWADAARAAATAVARADEVERLLDEADRLAADPTAAPLPTLARAERLLREAQAAERSLEEAYRLVTQAGAAVASEIGVARAALRQALATRDGLEPDDAERLGAAIRDVEEELAEIEPAAGRRPIEAVDRIARLRDRLDLALGDARTAQQRLRGARTALPGTLAAARAAIAHAEASVDRTHTGADARVRLSAAQRELAAARQASDPVEALDAARRAMRDAEDAQALADYDRLTGR